MTTTATITSAYEEPHISVTASNYRNPISSGAVVGGISKAWLFMGGYTSTIVNLAPVVADGFHRLAAQWHDATDMYSIDSQKVAHPSYLRIIAFGKVMIPYILSDLATRGGSWYSALEALTGMSPVGPEDTANVRLRKAAWLRWGKTNGYLGVGYVSYAISGKLLSQFAP